MRSVCRLATTHWPAALVVVAVMCNTGWPAAVASLVLLFRKDVAAAIHRRRITVEGVGFRVTLSDDVTPSPGGK